MKIKILALALAGTIGLVGCGSDDNDVAQQLDIVETAIANGSFNTLVTAVTTADLVGTLQGEGPFTVFAPTDDAFTAYLTENDITSADLLADNSLSDILTYHVLAGEVLANAAISIAQSDSNTTSTLSGSDSNSENGALVALSLTGEDLYVNLSKVIIPNVQTSNGVIHAINKVLVPPTASDLSDTNETIAGLVTALAGASVPEFTTLLAALSQEGLDTSLDGAGPFTVFAPTDAAFVALIAALDDVDDASDLLALPNLADILKQHVINGSEIDSVMAFAANGADIQTLNSAAEVSILINDGVLTIEGAPVVITDVQTSNGVIHVISSVIATTDTSLSEM
jgi:transforming growth factor-beta-induced protein